MKEFKEIVFKQSYFNALSNISREILKEVIYI